MGEDVGKGRGQLRIPVIVRVDAVAVPVGVSLGQLIDVDDLAAGLAGGCVAICMRPTCYALHDGRVAA